MEENMHQWHSVSHLPSDQPFCRVHPCPWHPDNTKTSIIYPSILKFSDEVNFVGDKIEINMKLCKQESLP